MESYIWYWRDPNLQCRDASDILLLQFLRWGLVLPVHRERYTVPNGELFIIRIAEAQWWIPSGCRAKNRTPDLPCEGTHANNLAILHSPHPTAPHPHLASPHPNLYATAHLTAMLPHKATPPPDIYCFTWVAYLTSGCGVAEWIARLPAARSWVVWRCTPWAELQWPG